MDHCFALVKQDKSRDPRFVVLFIFHPRKGPLAFRGLVGPPCQKRVKGPPSWPQAESILELLDCGELNLNLALHVSILHGAPSPEAVATLIEVGSRPSGRGIRVRGRRGGRQVFTNSDGLGLGHDTRFVLMVNQHTQS